jgi:hypothetical protein
MASTRNLNTPGDYKMENQMYENNLNYLIDKNNMYGVPKDTYFPGNGLLMGRIASENLANNYCDIESELFGIGSTNLVNPKPEVKPDIYSFKNLNIMNRVKMVIPEPLKINENQRPYPMK